MSDEESSQAKAFHFLFSHVGCRGLTQPEISHPKWNAFKRALSTTSLDYDVLRLTICCNYSHGPWGAGDRLVMKQEMLAAFLQRQPKEYFADMAQEIFRDQGSDSAPSDEDAAFLIEDFMSSEALNNRGAFVKNKQWFGMLDSIQTLLQNWTLQREAATAIMEMVGQQLPDDHEGGNEAGECEEGDDAVGGPPARKRWTKSDLYKAYKGRGPHAMNAEFLYDDVLRSKAVIIVEITAPLWPGCVEQCSNVVTIYFV